MEVLPRRPDVDLSSARMRNTRPPVQLFWEKRLAQVLTQVPPGARGEQLLRSLRLPQCLTDRLADPQSPFSSFALDRLTVLQSVIAAIQGLHSASTNSGASGATRSQQQAGAAAAGSSEAQEPKSEATPASLSIGQQFNPDAPFAASREQSAACGRARFHFEYAKQTHHSSQIEYRDIRQPLCPAFTGMLCYTIVVGCRPFSASDGCTDLEPNQLRTANSRARLVDEKTATSVLREESEACARVTALRRVLAGAMSALDARPTPKAPDLEEAPALAPAPAAAPCAAPTAAPPAAPPADTSAAPSADTPTAQAAAPTPAPATATTSAPASIPTPSSASAPASTTAHPSSAASPKTSEEAVASAELAVSSSVTELQNSDANAPAAASTALSNSIAAASDVAVASADPIAAAASLSSAPMVSAAPSTLTDIADPIAPTGSIPETAETRSGVEPEASVEPRAVPPQVLAQPELSCGSLPAKRVRIELQ